MKKTLEARCQPDVWEEQRQKELSDRWLEDLAVEAEKNLCYNRV